MNVSKPVFAGSDLEVGRRLEELRVKLMDLRQESRVAGVALQSAQRDLDRAHVAFRSAEGRTLAGIAGDDEVKVATAALRRAEKSHAQAQEAADQNTLASTAIEAEITSLVAEHSEELGAERTVALEAAVDAGMRSLAGLAVDVERTREQLRRLWEFRAMAGMSNQDLPDPAWLGGSSAALSDIRSRLDQMHLHGSEVAA